MKKVLSLLLTVMIIVSCFTFMTVSMNAATKHPSGYYVVGNFNNWTLNEAYQMSREKYDCDNDNGDDYVLKGVKLNAGDELKVGHTENGIRICTWYPDSGPETNYIVPDDSYYNIALALRTNETLGDWDWQLWVDPCDPPINDGEPIVPEPINNTKVLWEKNAVLTSEDIEEAANEQYHSRNYFFADDITIMNSYRFNCAPAYAVDFYVKDYGIYCAVILEELLGDYLLYSTSSYEPSIFVNDKLYTFTKAYQAGILTEEMLAELVAADYRGGYYGGCRILTRNIKGDADGDGDVNIIDATYVQRYDVNIIGADAIYKPLADIDGDRAVDIIDATLIQRYDVGLYEI